MSRTIYTLEEMAEWPKGFKRCRDCKELQPLESFHKMKQCIFGVSNICKSCRKIQSAAHWVQKPYIRKMYDRAKTRATKRGIPFYITVEDIVMPDRCPVFGHPWEYEPGSPWVPSLDRIDSDEGYIPGNVQVISWRANTLKNNMDPIEAKLLSGFMNGEGAFAFLD